MCFSCKIERICEVLDVDTVKETINQSWFVFNNFIPSAWRWGEEELEGAGHALFRVKLELSVS